MHRELLLLGLLRRKEMHGYELNEFIQRDLAACSDMKKPTAYFLLNKMAEQGWIVEESSQVGNRPPRRTYRLTAAGEAAFQRLLRQNLAAYQPPAFPEDTGLAFLEALSRAEAQELLEARRQVLLEQVAAAAAVPEHPGSLQWLVEHRQRHLRAELDWLDTLLARLKSDPLVE